MTATEQRPLVLRFGGKLVEQLGAQLYPQVTASVAELVSNAWDADAASVWITIPFDEDWDSGATIEVLDDGHGMTYEQARTRYLIVGRNRRQELQSDRTEGGRLLHGRKGIGKLAAFGTAGYLECVTVRGGTTTSFGIDYARLREHDPNEDYPVEEVADPQPLTDPATGSELPSGTRVRMTRLKSKRRTSEAVFRRSMARRFALESTEMRVWINGEPLGRFDYPVQIRFPRDSIPAGAEVEVDQGWARESIPYPSEADPDGRREVRWWLGFTAKPIAEEDMRGVSVLSRGKLAQRPFMFESALGTTGQLGQEYLVGEVSADWLDHGTDADDDLIQSNRDQLQFDNAELQPFLDWGRDRLRWALARRNEMRRDDRAGPGALGRDLEQVLEKMPRSSRSRMRTLAGRIAEVTSADGDALAKAVEAVVAAGDASVGERAAAELQLEGDPDNDATWTLLDDVASASASARRGLLRARLGALEQFALAVREPPVPRLHRAIAQAPWILSPLLENVAAETLQADEHVAVFRFPPLPPVFGGLTVAAWAVGDLAEQPPEGEVLDLCVASGFGEGFGVETLSWKGVIEASQHAHHILID